VTRLLVVALTASLLAGCHTFHFQVSNAPAETVPIQEHKSFFIAGLFPTHEIDVRGICPHGVAAIEEETTGLDALAVVLTLSLYTPRSSRYFCRLAPVPSAEAAPAPEVTPP
jgi:hypothetical protein